MTPLRNSTSSASADALAAVVRAGDAAGPTVSGATRQAVTSVLAVRPELCAPALVALLRAPRVLGCAR